MFSTQRLLARASSVGTQSAGLKQVPPALLPPIPLYRRLLRGHRKFLPKEMRLLGDEYVKSEFRAHREIDNPVHIVRALQRHHPLRSLTNNSGADWLSLGMARLCTADRGRFMERRKDGQDQD